MRQRGFTLLEVLIATALLGIGLVAVLGLLNRSLELTSQAVERRRDAEMAAELSGTLDLPLALQRDAQAEVEKRYPGRKWRLERRPTLSPEVEQLEIQVYRGEEREPSYRLARFLETKGAG